MRIRRAQLRNRTRQYITKLMSYSRKVGELETKLLQLLTEAEQYLADEFTTKPNGTFASNPTDES
jgi:hypothetical protein